MTMSQRQLAADNVAARACPNCGDLNPEGVDECYSCGYDGHCHICREPTQLSDFVDLNYCSTVCAREAQREREVRV